MISGLSSTEHKVKRWCWCLGRGEVVKQLLCPADGRPPPRFPEGLQSFLLTFSCDLETFPHFSTSSEVNAYQMDLSSSDFRSIFAERPCVAHEQLHFPARRSAAAFTQQRRASGAGEHCQAECRAEHTDRCANCKGPKGVRCRADLKRRGVEIKLLHSPTCCQTVNTSQ